MGASARRGARGSRWRVVRRPRPRCATNAPSFLPAPAAATAGRNLLMRRRLDDRYELDDDPARVDVDVTHAFLTESYWAEGRTRETVERLVSHAARVIGIYRDGKMVGFCR